MRKQIWTSMTPEERETVDRAVDVADYGSRSEFLRELALAHARKILKNHGITPPDAQKEEALA